MNPTGIIELPCTGSVPETVERLVALLNARGIKIFARIDQAGEARSVGLSLPPTVLVIFGDPRTGTPLMEKYPTLAVDLPLKALISESAEGTVTLRYNSPEFLQSRHQMAALPFAPLAALFEAAAKPLAE
jgi:uncharacterized protein (DUF302 family)